VSAFTATGGLASPTTGTHDSRRYLLRRRLFFHCLLLLCAVPLDQNQCRNACRRTQLCSVTKEKTPTVSLTCLFRTDNAYITLQHCWCGVLHYGCLYRAAAIISIPLVVPPTCCHDAHHARLPYNTLFPAFALPHMQHGALPRFTPAPRDAAFPACFANNAFSATIPFHHRTA